MAGGEVVVLSVEPKCTICQSPAADQVNAWLLRWRQGDREAGRKITLPYLCSSVLPILLGRELSDASVKRHLRHVRFDLPAVPEPGSDDDTSSSVNAEAEAMLGEIDGLLEGEDVSPTGLLDLQQRAYLLSLRRRIANGERIEVSHDQAARAAQRVLEAGRSQQHASLIAILGQGISRAFQSSLAAERGELVEGEAVEVEEVEAA